LELALIDPIALQIGPLAIRWYGLAFVSGVIAAVIVAMRAAKHRGLDPDFVPDLAMIIVPSGILGARLYEVFVLQWPYYRLNPGEILAIWQGGLAIHGGIILGLICSYAYTIYRKQSFWLWADIILPGVILAQAFGRWGNFFNQEAYGSPAPLWLIDLMPKFLREGMTIGGVVMHPTFLYESVWNLLGFAFLYWLVHRKPAEGTVFSLYLIFYNVGRLVIESIREDSTILFGWLRVAQGMAVLQIVVGILLYVWLSTRPRRGTP